MRRTLTWIAAVAVALVACAWLAAPMFAGWAARVAAQRAGLAAVDVDIARIGLAQVQARGVSFRADTDRGPVTIALQNATIDFDLGARTFGPLHAETGSLDWQPPAVPAPPPTAAIPAPVLPLVSARVDKFNLRLNLAPGTVTLTGPLALDLDPGAGAHARLTAADAMFDLTFSADGQQIVAALTGDAQTPLARAVVGDPLGLATRVELDLGLDALRTWVAARAGLPPTWREAAAGMALDAGTARVQAQYLVAGDTWRVDELAANWRALQAAGTRSTGALKLAAVPDGKQWQLRALAPGEITIERLDEKDAMSARIDIAEGTHVTAEPPDSWQGAGQINVSVQGAGIPDTRASIDQWQFTPAAAALQLRDLAVSKPALRAAELQVHATPGSEGWPGASGDASLAGIHPDISAITPELILKTAWQLESGKRIAATFDSVLDGQPAASGTLAWDLAAAEGKVQAKWSTDTGSLVAWARALFPPLEAAGAERGVLSGAADLAWRGGAVHGTARAHLADLSARYEEARVDGADIVVDVTDVAAPAYTFALSVPTATAATGLPVNGLFLKGAAAGQKITVREGGVQLWGGAMRVQPGTIDTRKDSRLVVEVDNLDLEQALRFVDVAGLGGTGRLTGTVPFLFRAGGVEIEQATLASIAPGTLRYLSAAPAAASNIALQALQDFRYATLSAGLAYGRDGDYTISARLRGSNPALYSGYPIAFNINLTGSLPGLLRGALLTGDFDREVMKQVRLDAGSPAPVPAAPAPDRRPPGAGR